MSALWACMYFIGRARGFSAGCAPMLPWNFELPDGVHTLSKWDSLVLERSHSRSLCRPLCKPGLCPGTLAGYMG